MARGQFKKRNFAIVESKRKAWVFCWIQFFSSPCKYKLEACNRNLERFVLNSILCELAKPRIQLVISFWIDIWNAKEGSPDLWDQHMYYKGVSYLSARNARTPISVQISTTPGNALQVNIIILISNERKWTMNNSIQCINVKVDVDMLNAIKSMLADVSSVSPSSE